MAHKIFNETDIKNAIHNSQYSGPSVVDTKRVYFILAISGTSLVLKNASGVTVFTSAGSVSFEHPIRLDGGFALTGTTPIAIYAVI